MLGFGPQPNDARVTKKTRMFAMKNDLFLSSFLISCSFVLIRG